MEKRLPYLFPMETVSRAFCSQISAEKSLIMLKKESCETVNPDVQVHVGKGLSGVSLFLTGRKSIVWHQSSTDPARI